MKSLSICFLLNSNAHYLCIAGFNPRLNALNEQIKMKSLFSIYFKPEKVFQMLDNVFKKIKSRKLEFIVVNLLNLFARAVLLES